ncbi:hypothetical protein CGLO_13416 [Colletotrichum gloeosporioides Cg-14]|uniref:Uncharacterized protein n=1 Tax=Colletotrichum gloeosporioides (strain Cg-14) TaxID=1237896 RepID=T0K3W3_COLGC|nr:hypothetical protein CGLO_13416 [Colletotrichum gloeosporioides Cg-14]
MDDRTQRQEGAVPAGTDTDSASSDSITTTYLEANSGDDTRSDGHAEQTEEDETNDDDGIPRTAAGRRFATSPIHPDASTSTHYCSRCRKTRYRWWFERFPAKDPRNLRGAGMQV